MGRFGSANKGRVAERAVAKICQEWWGRLEATCRFLRTPQSGGWSGPEERKYFRASGDLMTTARRWPFTVEVKHREQWSVRRFLDGKQSTVWGWWRQAVEQAAEEGGVPMLWLRRNRLPGGKSFPWLVLIPEEFYLERNVNKPHGRLPEPDVMWGEALLVENGVDHAGVVPVLYFYERLVRISPQRLMR